MRGANHQHVVCTWCLIWLVVEWQTVHDKWRIEIIGILCVCVCVLYFTEIFQFPLRIELNLSGHKLYTYSHWTRRHKQMQKK